MRKWPRERDRKDQQEKRAWNQNPLLWYLCHHHRWSIRLNIICLPEQDMTRETEREKGRGKKMTHLLQCWQMWRHRRTFPSKKNKKKNIQRKKCDISLLLFSLRIHLMAPTLLPFLHSLTTCSYQRGVILFLSPSFQSARQEKKSTSVTLSDSPCPSLPSLVYLTFAPICS